AVVPHGISADLVGCIAKDECTYQMRMVRSQTLGDHATYGKADDNSVRDIEMPKKSGQIIDVVVKPIGLGRGVGQAVAALVIEDEAVVVGEAIRNLFPDAEIRAERI